MGYIYGYICIWDTCMDTYICNSQDGRHIWKIYEQEEMDIWIHTYVRNSHICKL